MLRISLFGLFYSVYQIPVNEAPFLSVDPGLEIDDLSTDAFKQSFELGYAPFFCYLAPGCLLTKSCRKHLALFKVKVRRSELLQLRKAPPNFPLAKFQDRPVCPPRLFLSAHHGPRPRGRRHRPKELHREKLLPPRLVKRHPQPKPQQIPLERAEFAGELCNLPPAPFLMAWEQGSYEMRQQGC